MKRNIILVFFILSLFSCRFENNSNPEPEADTTIIQSESENSSSKTSTTSQTDLSIREQMQLELTELHKKLISQMDTGIDPQGVAKYLKESESYMNLYGDSLAAEHIFQAADLASGIGDHENALNYWRIVYQAYAQDNHPKVPHAIFSVAFLYENVLDRKDLAKTMYKQLLAKFPDHELAAETVKILKNIDKSPEDLIKGFQRQ